MTRARHPGQAGFSLAEVLVAVVIISIVSAMVIPVVFGKMRQSQEAALAQTFVGLSQSIAEFKRATTRYPQLLASLSTQPAGTDLDICGNQLLSTNTAYWRGPYTSRTLTASGVVTGEYTVSNTLRRVAGTPTYLFIDVGGVEDDVVLDLESQFDTGTASGTTGTIQYTTAVVGSLAATSTGYYNLSFGIPINSC